MANANDLYASLAEFCLTTPIRGKGALCVVLFISRYARDHGLPLKPDDLVTEGTGQVLGLGKGAVQRILAEYGVSQVLAEEGGRTSRGSLGNMRAYVDFLNNLNKQGLADTKVIEGWWVEKVKEHFSAKPLKLRFDPSKGLQAIVQDILNQAKKRQQEATGTMYQGAVLQHLVGAKLVLAMPELEIKHNGFSVADSFSERSGDFVLDESVIHVTTSPGEALIRKCQQNIDAGAKPIILTLMDGVAVAKGLARNAGLDGRIDVMDTEQFLAANLHELSLFKTSERRSTFLKLIETYNRIVDENETDPSLKIEIG